MADTLRQRLETDLREAMKSGDQSGRDALRFVLSAVKNAEIERRRPLSEVDEIALLRQQAKQRSEAIEQFRAGERHDLADREAAQLALIERYLPPQLSDDDLRSMVEAAIEEVGATGPRDMGKVMKVLTDRAAGRADGRRLSTAAKDALARQVQ